MGITPILSHVERNLKFQQKPALLSQLIQKGVLAQITAASLCGFFGPIPKKIAQKFLSEDLVYSIASDAHTDSKEGRGSFFSQALTEASKIIGHQAVLNLVHSNPKKIIMNISSLSRGGIKVGRWRMCRWKWMWRPYLVLSVRKRRI